MQLIRKITGEESIFYRAPEANVSLVARIDGEVNENDLKSAIKRVTDLYPLLKAHVVMDKNSDIWFGLDENIEIPLKIVPKISDNQWQNVVQEEYKIPFDVEKGPLIRFILLKSLNTSDLLVFCQHIICDGLSLVNLIDTILKLLENPKCDFNIEENICLPIPENIALPKENNKFGDFTKKVIMNYVNKRWKKTKIDFNQGDFLQIHKSFSEKYNYKIILTEFSEEDTIKLKEKCRDNNVTVNSAISVAFLAGRKDIISNYSNPIQGVAVSVRNRLKRPVGNAFGCFVSDIGFKFNYTEKQCFWDNVKSYHKKVRNELDNFKDLQSQISLSNMDYTLMEALTFSRHISYNPSKFDNYERLNRLSPKKKNIATLLSKAGLKEYPGLLITNLGALDFKYNNDKIKLDKIYFAPSSIPMQEGGMIIGALSVNNKLIITLNIMISNEESDYFNLMNEINNNAIMHLHSNIN